MLSETELIMAIRGFSFSLIKKLEGMKSVFNEFLQLICQRKLVVMTFYFQLKFSTKINLVIELKHMYLTFVIQYLTVVISHKPNRPMVQFGDMENSLPTLPETNET